MFDKITIIGVGLLGGSFALAVKKHHLAKKIVGVTRYLSSAQEACDLGIIDEASDSIGDAVFGADLVLIATPVMSIKPVLAELSQHISKQCVITDVCSVKQVLVDLVRDEFPELTHQFVFSHPIAGGELSGHVAAKSDLFEGKHLVLVDTESTNPNNVERLRYLWEIIGSKVVNMTAEEHDRIFAYTSHLPHVVACALMNSLSHQESSEQLFDLASNGFYDFTRIASANPEIWRDICLTNKNELLASIKVFSKQLQHIETMIENHQTNALGNIFMEAKNARDNGLYLDK